MKIEIDFVDAIEKSKKEIKMKNGDVYYQHQLKIKSKYDTILIIAKSYNEQIIKNVKPQQSELKEGDKIEKKKK